MAALVHDKSLTLASVAPAEESGVVFFSQQVEQVFHMRGLASPAAGQVADADSGYGHGLLFDDAYIEQQIAQPHDDAIPHREREQTPG